MRYSHLSVERVKGQSASPGAGFHNRGRSAGGKDNNGDDLLGDHFGQFRVSLVMVYRQFFSR